MKENIRETTYFRLEVLTPLHVGSGNRYQPGLDYEILDGSISVLSQNLFFQYMEQLSSEKISRFSQAIEKKTIFNELRNDTHLDSICRYRKPFNIGGNRLDEIHEQIRDASGNPLIPGSSLKGAIRTAILQYLVHNDRQKPLQQELDKLLGSKKTINPKFADSELIKKMLGDDPKYNLMKTVTVGDLVFERQHIIPMVSKTTRLINKENFEAKKFAMGVEAITKGSVAYGFLSFDEYLKNKANSAECFKFKTILDTGFILKILRHCTSSLIQEEIKFLRGKAGDYLPELLENYRHLNECINTLGENEALFNLGWGIGWRGMTGALLSQDDLNKKGVRDRFKLAQKYTSFPFPKSRRIALTYHNDVQPLGWVRLSVCSEAEYRDAMTKVTINRREILREAAERKDRIDKRKAEENRKLAAIRKEQALRTAELRRQQEEEERYPWRIHLKRLEGIQDWGSLRTQVLENQELIKFQNNPEVGSFVRELAEKVRIKWQSKWNQDRDTDIANWLKPSGFEWPASVTVRRDAQPQLSDADKELMDKIAGLRDWGQYKNSGLNLNSLPDAALHRLRERFKEWNCDRSDAKKDKKEAWKDLKRLIKQHTV
ncbi:MAG: RAMP superfamily protein [Syntrophus sp. PtaU1.Bin208]|nr:MAG: RAMP superfamily protein [Syntrophus sp. PtaU1.Bin208]